MDGGWLAQAFAYLAAAVIAVPIAQRFGLGSVLGYLIAGVLIGPFAIGVLGTDRQDVLHFAEFGVVMMLFVIGLELEPVLLWRLRHLILGLGGLQVAVTGAVMAAIAIGIGVPVRAAIAIGFTLSLSSTAIVLQTLNERSLLGTAGGQGAFAVLLFQDIAVIPMLALFPLLAPSGAAARADEHAGTLVSHLPAWGQTVAVLVAVGVVIAGGRFVLGPMLRQIARTRLREMFTAATLLIVVGIALLMGAVGLSAALGTFLAGVLLANSEFRHELESDIDPFKGLLLGLFFIAVGASIDFSLVRSQPLNIVSLVAGIVLVKFLVLLGLGRVFRLSLDQAMLIALGLPQVGEFAFVLFSFAGQQRVLTPGQTGPLVAAVALSMAVTPLLLLVYQRVVQPRLGVRPPPEREPDVRDERGTVLVAGFGSFGSTVGRLLRASGVPTTVLDIDSDRVDLLRRMGLAVHYGDATRADLLLAAGAARARLIVIALDQPERTLELVETVRKHFPQLTILARAFDWQDAHELLDAGVTHVYRDTLDTSLRLGADALRLLGVRAYRAHRAAQRFLKHDEESMRELTGRRADRSVYVSAARQRIEDLERMFEADRAEPELDRDSGWDAESLREEARSV
jgi:CPA2 family monovalent cation:H+ antiporter-2/glutathione-regulated potassium-efflux system protein KefB